MISMFQLWHVEFKNYLERNFNNSFENLHSIICWDINTNEIKHNNDVKDIAGNKRTLKLFLQQVRMIIQDTFWMIPGQGEKLKFMFEIIFK